MKGKEMDNGVEFKRPQKKALQTGGEGILETLMQRVAFLESKVDLLEELLRETKQGIESERHQTPPVSLAIDPRD